MIVFIVGWILLTAYIVSGQKLPDSVPSWAHFLWLDTALLSITAGAFWMLFTW